MADRPHILFVHPNFPAQFGHIAAHLARHLGWRCTFTTQAAGPAIPGVERVQYAPAGGATAATHYCSRTFENAVWHTHAVYEALRARPDIRPDLVVGHSGFGSTLFLPELYPGVPVVNLFEYFYRPHHPDSDIDFRTDLGWPTDPATYMRARCRNAMILCDLNAATVGYTPTRFQRGCFPAEYQHKLRTVFDGIDRSVYHGHADALRPPPAQRGVRTIAGVSVHGSTRVVTYVSRGFESMRGFDIFMRSAKLIAREYPDVVFFVVGTDRIAYGGDTKHIAPHKTFREWTLAQDDYDLSKFVFTGLLPPTDLAKLLASTDVHIYITVPFVLSWSLLDAMSCGAVVVGSATAPVQEVVTDRTGLLADFFDPEAFCRATVGVLRNPADFRPLGRAAEALSDLNYSMATIVPQMVELYREACPALPLP